MILLGHQSGDITKGTPCPIFGKKEVGTFGKNFLFRISLGDVHWPKVYASTLEIKKKNAARKFRYSIFDISI